MTNLIPGKPARDGETPNAVLHNPIVSSGNVGGTGGPDQTPNSDDEDTRPYKCEPCNKAFRISGHLARHMKSELHLKRMQDRIELMLQFFRLF